MWAGLEAIDYFLSNDNEIFSIATALEDVPEDVRGQDANGLSETDHIHIHEPLNQEANVRWGSGETSKNFPIRNGTGQGIGSPRLLSLCSWWTVRIIRKEKSRMLDRRHDGGVRGWNMDAILMAALCD